MGISVRPATLEDLPEVLRLLAELPVTTGEGEVFEIEESRAQEIWQRMLRQEGRTILLAVEDGKIVGGLDLLVVPNLTHDGSPWAMIENVVVVEERRGRGIGRAIMEDAIARAKAAGCYKVQLMSFRERKDVHAFYESLGFEPLAVGFRLYF